MDTTAIDMNAKWLGVSTLQMMENAGAAVAREALSYQKSAIFAGMGNNGGDGLVAARHLASKGK